MEQNQDKLRNAVKRRCTPQNIAAKEIGITNIYFNAWLKNHRSLGSNTISKVNDWLAK